MLENLVVVSDIDDTIKWSHILGSEVEVLCDGLDYRLAFRGMPELYTALSSAGARIVYVTGGPDLLIGHFEANPIPQKVVSTNHFPDGEICLHKLGESTEDYKVRTITALMKRDEYSTFDFILIGDNGERDIVTYTRVKHDTEVGTRVRQVFIHKIYSGGSSLEPLDEQHPFITAADLAALLQGFGFITEEDLIEVINIVSAGMKDNGQDHNLTLPFAAQLVPDQVNAIFGSLSTTIGAPADALLHNLHELVLKQAKEGPRRF